LFALDQRPATGTAALSLLILSNCSACLASRQWQGSRYKSLGCNISRCQNTCAGQDCKLLCQQLCVLSGRDARNYNAELYVSF